MARGRDQHQARLNAVSKLGRSLARRSGSQCELCAGGSPLRVIEIEPVDEDPHEEAAILSCDPCRERLDGKSLDAGAMRFLEGSVWSEVLPAKIASITLLRKLAAKEVSWAQECLDGLWLDDDVQSKLERIK